MITINRSTGEAVITPLDEESKRKLKVAVVKAFVNAHPDIIELVAKESIGGISNAT